MQEIETTTARGTDHWNRADRGRLRFLAVRKFVRGRDWTHAGDIYANGPSASYAECQRALLCMWYYGEVERRREATQIFYRWIPPRKREPLT